MGACTHAWRYSYHSFERHSTRCFAIRTTKIEKLPTTSRLKYLAPPETLVIARAGETYAKKNSLITPKDIRVRWAFHALLRKSIPLYLVVYLSTFGLCLCGGARAADLACYQQDAPQQQIPGQTAKEKGAIQGILRDGTMHPVIGATVLLRNQASGFERKKSSDAQGVFRFIDLIPGSYELEIEGDGYQKYVEHEVQVNAGDALIREITLTAAALTAVSSPSNLPQLPPRVVSNNPETLEAPPSISYPGARQSLELTAGSEMAGPLAPPQATPVFSAEPDRWLLTMPEWNRYGTGGEHPYVKGKFWDPFNTNKLKGDVPIFGQQTFFNFTAISDTFFDGRRLPTPTGVSTAQPGTTGFFGKGNQAFVDQVFLFSFELFHGDTSFRPVDWRIRITPAISAARQAPETPKRKVSQLPSVMPISAG